MFPTESWHWLIPQFKAFLLIWLRVSGLFLVAPFFGSELIPERVKLLASFAMAGLVWNVWGAHMPPLPANLGLYVFACLTETAIGVIIGFTAALIFSSVQFAGQQVGMSMGIAIANVLDPVSNENVSVIGQLKFFTAFYLFMVLDLHHYLIQALVWTFERIPPLTLSYRPETVLFLTETVVGRIFTQGVILSAPAVVAIFIVTVAMGFMARAAPEMNIFIIGFAIRILVGFLFLIATVPVFIGVLYRYFGVMFKDLDRLIEGFRPLPGA